MKSLARRWRLDAPQTRPSPRARLTAHSGDQREALIFMMSSPPADTSVACAVRGTMVHCRRGFWRLGMKASLFYRIAAVLLVFFGVAHTLGFRQSDPAWGVESLLSLIRSIHFDVQGFSRTYWDLFVAAGFSVGVFYLFAAALAWQLGGLPAETLAGMRLTVWALALCFAAITIVSWRYLFLLPIVFSIVITSCLTAAAWLSAKQS
jgi:hypothetical protein